MEPIGTPQRMYVLTILSKSNSTLDNELAEAMQLNADTMSGLLSRL